MAALCATPGFAPADEVSRTSFGTHFGDHLPNLPPSLVATVQEGERLFVRAWRQLGDNGPAFNGVSCVSCHNMPMPGGSGSGDRAFSFVQPADDAASGLRTRHRHAPNLPVISTPPPGFYRLRAPPLYGIGFLEAASFISKTAHDAKIGEGTSAPVGRLGSMGRLADLEAFVEAAFRDELGITFELDSIGQRAPAVRQVATYLRFLAPPPAQPRTAEVAAGEVVFVQIGCARCHSQRLRTRADSAEPLRARTVSAYTDLRRHVVRSASVPLRTPPLWGLRSVGPPYLHDGSAISVPAAIEAHVEAAISESKAFKNLSDMDRLSLIEFLLSL